MNTKLLRKIQKAIIKYPDQFDMSNWFEKKKGIGRCGTSACLAGWAVTIKNRSQNPLKVALELFPRDAYRFNIESAPYLGGRFNSEMENLGMEYLEISKREAERLFFTTCWPQKYESVYLNAIRAKHYKKAARIAFNRINHFIKTEGRE